MKKINLNDLVDTSEMKKDSTEKNLDEVCEANSPIVMVTKVSDGNSKGIQVRTRGTFTSICERDG